ncbi:MAG: NUDIX hydrolase [Oscillospiraceae bacterium]|nr:NUDIX hydrolase [Oscillospiraceae bacterium]
MESFITGIENEVKNNPINIPTTAFVIVESDKGYMLLYNKHYNRWELTGGYMEQNESPIDCAIRECKEESNQNLLQLQFFGIARYKTMNAAIYYSFLHEENVFIENDEINGLLWWKPHDDIVGNIDAESLKLIELYVASL